MAKREAKPKIYEQLGLVVPGSKQRAAEHEEART